MTAYKYYQLVTLDGKETPRFYYRQGDSGDDIWNPTSNQWVPTHDLLGMITKNETALDRIDYDPTSDQQEVS
jgi:hypothetical protein